MRKTKIIATIGPSSKDKVVLEDLILNGMNVARLNTKYSSLDFCYDVIESIREIDKKLKKNTSILIDLEGPIIRVGKFKGGKTLYRESDKIRIYMDAILGDETKFSVSYSNLIDDLKSNAVLKISNGKVVLKVLDKGNGCLLCEVVKGGIVEDDSIIRIVNTKINMPFISKKDFETIKFANENKVDYLGVSGVTGSEDILEVNDKLIEIGDDHLQIVTKIETMKALEDIDEIIKASDGIIISRGNLAVEILSERIPGIQKILINKCHLYSKFSVIAADMLSFGDFETKPNRAEMTDIAVSINDMIDAIMVSGETTIGKFPVGTIISLGKSIETIEEDVIYNELLDKVMKSEKQDITSSLAYSVVDISSRLKTIAIVTPTMSGYTAKKISRFRPNCPVIAITPEKEVALSLGIYYGIHPVLINETKSFDTILKASKCEAMKLTHEKGDKIVITGGYPFKESKHTNFMKIEEL